MRTILGWIDERSLRVSAVDAAGSRKANEARSRARPSCSPALDSNVSDPLWTSPAPLLLGTRRPHNSVKQCSLLQLGAGRRAHLRQPHNLRPALHERVVGERLLRPLLPLADRVEPIGQLAGYIGLAPKLRHQLRRAG